MGNLNPFQLVALLKNGNPRAFAEQVIAQNYPNNPEMQNLLQMAQRGDTKGIEQYAQQFFSRQGRDYSTEMNNLISMLKGM